MLNWYLSLAVIFGREGQSFRGAFRQARQTVRLQRSDFAGTGFVFLLFRIVALLVALAICGLTSRHVTARRRKPISRCVMIVTLVWCAISDFLYMARMAAYLALAAAHVEPGGPKLVVSSPTAPAENPSTHLIYLYTRRESEKIVRGRPIHRHSRLRFAIHTAHCPPYPRTQSIFRCSALHRPV